MENERTFTQAEVDQIISERLRKERNRFQQEAQQREAELTRREQLLSAKEDWSRRGLPLDLLDNLDLSKDGAMEAAASIVERIRVPEVSNRGGTFYVGQTTSERTADSTREAFGLQRKDV
ncbi:MAG: hypothetical protein Q4E13_08520 [Clostridia bacterium]|nr:hypothetical protein [Clostridia bacterium]